MVALLTIISHCQNVLTFFNLGGRAAFRGFLDEVEQFFIFDYLQEVSVQRLSSLARVPLPLLWAECSNNSGGFCWWRLFLDMEKDLNFY